MGDFSRYFMYIPGVIIFLLGSGQFRNWLSTVRQGAISGRILRCDHVIKKDNKGRDTFNYYNTLVEYTNPGTGHKEQHAIKTPTEYSVGQQITISRSASGRDITIMDAADDPVFHPFLVMVGGALMIVLVLFQNQGREVYAMCCLSLLLLGAGLGMIYHYISGSKRKLKPIEATIIDIYSRQLSRSTKIIRGDKFTYYPVVRYTIGNTENTLRCHVNSDRESGFKIGDTITLYYDEETSMVTEQRTKRSILVGGVILALLGIAAGLSILPVIIG